MISVVVPVYNEEECIAQTLASLLAQDYTLPYEVIVVDTGSTDRTDEIVRRFPVTIIGAAHGKLAGRRAGIDAASGWLIVAADGDTYYPPQWLGLLTRHFNNPQVVAVSGPWSYEGAGLLTAAPIWTNVILPRPNVMHGCNSAFRADAYFRVGGFRWVNELDFYSVREEEEWDFGSRLAGIGRYVYDREAICYTSIRRYETGNKHAEERARGERF